MKISEVNSRKITFLNFALILLIVLLHCNNRSIVNYNFRPTETYEIIANYIYSFITLIAETAVPTFFALSGYLFFRNCTESTVTKKWKRRFKTILIPYLIWNIIFYLPYAIINLIPALKSQINLQIPFPHIYDLLFANYSNPPLWYLKELFILQLISPCIFYIFKYVNLKIIISILTVYVIGDIYFQLGYSNILHWIPVYFGAGAISFYHSTYIENDLNTTIQQYKTAFAFLTAGCFAICALTRLQWVVAPLCWMLILGLLNDIRNRSYYKFSFFIFLTHYFCILTIRKVLLFVLGTSFIAMLISYLLCFFITVILLITLAYFLNKKFPRLYAILCGNR